MKNPTYTPMYMPYPSQKKPETALLTAFKPLIQKQLKKSLSKLSKHIAEHQLQAGILHLFFGEHVANAYRVGKDDYFAHYFEQIPSVLFTWLSTQLHDNKNELTGELFTSITRCISTQRQHLLKLSSRGKVSSLALHTAFFPACTPYLYKGIGNALHSSFTPCPFFTVTPQDHAEGIHAFLTWALQTAKEHMLVTLDDAKSFHALKSLQKERQLNHQLHILDAIVAGYKDSLLRDSPSNTFIPASSQRSQLSYEGVRYCSYETFLHLTANDKGQQVSFAAKNILSQLDHDYLHHGLVLNRAELTLFLTLHFSTQTSELMIADDAVEDFYASDLGRAILKRYITVDQIHYILANHNLFKSEKDERLEWYNCFKKSNLPPRLQNKIKKLILPFNKMYTITVNHRNTFFYDLKDLYQQYDCSFDGYLSSFPQLLLDAGCSVKYVLQAYERFSYSTRYLRQYTVSTTREHYTLDLNYLHDFYLVLHPPLLRFFSTLKQHTEKKKAKKIANIVLKSILTYNLSSSANILELTKLLTALSIKLERGHLLNKEVVSQVSNNSSITAILALCGDRELKINDLTLYTIKNALNVDEKHLAMASKMLIKEPYIDLCLKLSEPKNHPLFNTPPVIKEVLQEHDHFHVGVLAHNNPVALLGPGLSNVCIDLDSSYHHQQLNPSFANICIYNDDQLILWGLLCRTYNEDSDEVIYILNNFQGSINNRYIEAPKVRDAVLSVFQLFMQQNGVDAIFMKDQYFNATNLCQDLPTIQTKRNNYYLERGARLDFEVNRQGSVQQDEFYILKAD